MTQEQIECLSDEVLLNQFADCYGQSVFCGGNRWLKEDVNMLKDEILRRMKNEK